MDAEKADHQKETVLAIDKDKGSQYALKWVVDQLLPKIQIITFLHIHQKSFGSQGGMPEEPPKALAAAFREMFLPFRCFCTRKDIKCNEVVVEETDIAKGIIDYVTANEVEVLVMGSPKGGLVRRFKANDVPSTVAKGAPNFCTVYTINKGKVQSVQHATASVPPKPNSSFQLPITSSDPSDQQPCRGPYISRGQVPGFTEYGGDIKSPFNRNKGAKYEPSTPETDISFVSSGRPTSFYHLMSDSGTTASRLSSSSEQEVRSYASLYSGGRSIDIMDSSQYDYSMCSQNSGRTSVSSSSSNMDEIEAEMRRLRLELKQTMDMYSSACKEALTAKQKAMELHQSKLEEQQKLKEAQLAGEAALALVEKEKQKCKAATEAAEAAQRLAELEAQKRKHAEMKALKEAEEKNKALQSLAHGEVRYRKYTIEQIEAATQDFSTSLKIGEGGYGPVYKGYLDHTPVAIKVLRPDAAQGQSQFQQEVEVLSCIRHPYMVLLLGACPEYGCLVYEYMANGSLDDRLFRRGNTPPLSWQVRFRIAAEIATALLFLHQAKPEPIVHRDLKPGNILLDRNYVSRISDVGLARLVPPSVVDTVTQYRMTSTAGTFCYIDPEYQQTGLVGTKSDIYSLGIMLLQIITAKPPMGLSHHVERAIEKGTFADMLDPAVPDWPVPEALMFAKLALQCAELRRKDRPDLGKVILPELNRLRALAEENWPSLVTGGTMSSLNHSQFSAYQEFISDQQSGYESSKSRSSSSAYGGRW